jgi:hypothetical protein
VQTAERYFVYSVTNAASAVVTLQLRAPAGIGYVALMDSTRMMMFPLAAGTVVEFSNLAMTELNGKKYRVCQDQTGIDASETRNDGSGLAISATSKFKLCDMAGAPLDTSNTATYVPQQPPTHDGVGWDDTASVAKATMTRRFLEPGKWNHPHYLAFADLDGDGHRDIVFQKAFTC